MPVYKKLPPSALVIPKEPAAPPANCRDAKNRRTVCNRDAVNQLDAYRTGFRQLVSQLREIIRLQPVEGEKVK